MRSSSSSSLIGSLVWLFLCLTIHSTAFEIYGNEGDDYDVSKFGLGITSNTLQSSSSKGLLDSTPEQEAVIAMLEEQNREWMALSTTGGACSTPGMCKNGGTCNSINTNQFSCLCTPLWTGDQCDIPASSSSSAAIIAPTGLTTHLSSSLMSGCGNAPCRNNGTCIIDQTSIGGYRCQCKAGFNGTNCEIFLPTTPPPIAPATPAITEGSTGLAAGGITIAKSRNGNSGYYILGAIAASFSIGFLVFVAAKREVDVAPLLKPRKTLRRRKEKNEEKEEKKFADDDRPPTGGAAASDVIIDTGSIEAKADEPQPMSYSYVMDFRSVFALKNNVLDQRGASGAMGETAATPIDPQRDVHFVLHE